MGLKTNTAKRCVNEMRPKPRVHSIMNLGRKATEYAPIRTHKKARSTV